MRTAAACVLWWSDRVWSRSSVRWGSGELEVDDCPDQEVASDVGDEPDGNRQIQQEGNKESQSGPESRAATCER